MSRPAWQILNVVGPALALGLGLWISLTPVLVAAEPSPWFGEFANNAGIAFEHERALEKRLWFPEIMSGGGCLLDFDGDGWLDLYLVQGGALAQEEAAEDTPSNQLFRNLGLRDGALKFENVSTRTGIADRTYGMGCAVGDIDGDGDSDLYVTNVGPNRLYRNNGDGSFQDITQSAGVGGESWSSSALFFDADTDGDLDLYVVNYVNWSPNKEIECYSGGKTRDYCHPDNYNSPAPDVFYRNRGDGTFEDASIPSGIRRAVGNGLGVAAADFDGDGRIDLYVANDGDPNQLWMNRGARFEDEALLTGSAVNRHGLAEAGMGIAVADLEADGDVDLFLTHLRDESNTLYLQDGGLFEDRTVSADLAASSIRYTGFGTGFADFDHDGELDLFVANGRVGLGLEIAGPYAEPNLLWQGSNSGQFRRIVDEEAWGSPRQENSRAAIFGDLDSDGDIDAVIVNNGGKTRLLENLAGRRGNWIRFLATDEKGRGIQDAVINIRVGKKQQVRSAQPGYSYLASHDPRVHFGLGSASSVEEVMVVWPGGGKEQFGRFVAGKTHELRRGQGTKPPRTSQPPNR